MDDLISRQVALINIKEYIVNPENATGEHPDDVRQYNSGLLTAIEAINETPSIQQERAKGKWRDLGGEAFECLICHQISCYAHNYCPDCGTEMEGIIRWTF